MAFTLQYEIQTDERFPYQGADSEVRVTIIHNPNLNANAKLTDPETGVKLSNVIYQALYDSDISVDDLKSTFDAALKTEGHIGLVDQIKAFSAGSPIVEMITGGHAKDWSKLFSKLNDAGLQRDFQGVIINGRVSVLSFSMLNVLRPLD